MAARNGSARSIFIESETNMTVFHCGKFDAYQCGLYNHNLSVRFRSMHAVFYVAMRLIQARIRDQLTNDRNEILRAARSTSCFVRRNLLTGMALDS